MKPMLLVMLFCLSILGFGVLDGFRFNQVFIGFHSFYETILKGLLIKLRLRLVDKKLC